MKGALAPEALAHRVEQLLALRTDANEAFFADEAERIARLCHRMAERFARGGRLIAVGVSPAARSDVRHVAVEFVHPVIVGKRALPAFGLSAEAGPVVTRLDLAARADDIVIAFEPDEVIRAAVALARERGCLTFASAACGAEWEFAPPGDDPFVAQEVAETLYHVLWELVHTFLEHRGLLEGRSAEPVHDTGASSFLYPFLAEAEVDLESIVAGVRRSVVLKSEEIVALREQTLGENATVLAGAAQALRGAFESGATLLALGNGGSATDAMDAVADLVSPPRGWPARPALDLTEDSSIITAIANDVGVENVFARQVIAYGGEGDVVIAFSTSGDSGNVISALAEARRRKLTTIALVGYDGGQVARDRLADFVIVSRSQHIPRIQEAQASAWHVLRELVELA